VRRRSVVLFQWVTPLFREVRCFREPRERAVSSLISSV